MQKSYFGDTGRPVSKIYDADVIEQISFAECMIILVRAKTGYSNDMENADSFVKKAGKYIGMSGNSIEDAYGTIRYLC